jgi:hypothetical protein
MSNELRDFLQGALGSPHLRWDQDFLGAAS